MPDTLAFVSSISDTATVRLNLDDGKIWGAQGPGSEHGSCEFPPPPLKRSVVGTLMTDGEQIPASAYANREIKLVLRLLLTDSDDAATQYQLLMRELNRPQNILRLRVLGSSKPVFFRTFRAGPDALEWVSEEITKVVMCTIPAEPFAVGTRETIGPSVVNNNPAAASGCFLNLTSVKGDVETPILMTYDAVASVLSSVYCAGLAVGLRSGASPYPTLFRQAEALTQGLDTTTGADATMSGGSRSRITFATNTFQDRLSGTFPSASSPAPAENRGTYRILARVQSTVTATYELSITPNAATGTQYVVNPEARIIDLGLFSYGAASPTSPGNDSTPMTLTNVQSNFYFRARRISGSGSLDVDYFLAVPVDERYATWGVALAGDSAAQVVVDSYNHAIYPAVNPTGAAPELSLVASPPAFTGVYPHIPPGDSRLVIVQTLVAGETAGVGLANAISATMNVSIHYWPRYLNVRPATT